MTYIGMLIDRCSLMGCEEGVSLIGLYSVSEAIEITKNRLSWPGIKSIAPEYPELVGEYDWDYFNKTKCSVIEHNYVSQKSSIT